METLDQNILFLINGSYNSYFDALMSLISGKLIWLPLYVCILFVLWRRLRVSWQMLAVLLTIGATFFLTDFCCSHIVRPFFMRLRPVCVENPIHTMVHAVEGYRHNSYGFPSCHASNTFGLATLLFLFFRERWTSVSMFLWATVMCYSRVYLGVHYPGDVFVGALLGVAVGYAVYYASLALQRRYIKEPVTLTGSSPLVPLAVALMFALAAVIAGVTL